MEDKEVALNVSAGAERRGGPGIFRVTATLRQGKTPQEAEGLIEEEIAKLYSQPVTDKELQRARIALRRGAENRITALSRAQALADAAAVYNDPNRVNTEINAELAVTARRYRASGQALLVKSNRVVVVTTPAPAPVAAADGEASNENHIHRTRYSQRAPWRRKAPRPKVSAAWCA